jgi:hypothetical protein
MPVSKTYSPAESEAMLRKAFPEAADGMVRAHDIEGRYEVRMQKWQTSVSVIFSLLGAAGLVNTKAELLPHAAMTWSFVIGLVSLCIVIGLELYRAYGIEQKALKLLVAKETYAELEAQLKSALGKGNASLPDIYLLESIAPFLEKTFRSVLPVRDDAKVIHFIDQCVIQYRPDKGWSFPRGSQQKPRKGGET